jgi:hypothetical protein
MTARLWNALCWPVAFVCVVIVNAVVWEGRWPFVAACVVGWLLGTLAANRMSRLT